jgi:hypothetical protein
MHGGEGGWRHRWLRDSGCNPRCLRGSDDDSKPAAEPASALCAALDPKSNLRRLILWWKPGSGWGRCPQTPAPAAGFRNHCHPRISSPENSTLRTSSTVPILERTPERQRSESPSSSWAIRTLRRRQHRNSFTQRIGSRRISAHGPPAPESHSSVHLEARNQKPGRRSGPMWTL